MPEEGTVVARAKQGDRDALQALLEPLQAPVVRFLRRFVGSTDANDVAQETFFQVVTKFGQFENKSNLRAWVFRIAFRQMLNFQKSNRKVVEGMDDSKMPLDGDSHESVIQREQTSLILNAVDNLPEKQRQVVWLRISEEMTFREIATICDVSLNTVLSRMHQAKKRLVRELRSIGLEMKVPS